jgi:amino acid transporter
VKPGRPAPPDRGDDPDAADLRRLGYTQQLLREMGGFSNFAISFSIISVLTGAVLLYGYGLKLAGPIVNTIGWPVVSFFTLAVAASMAELASAYPTAGGLYFWAFRLGGRGWAWWTAWFNMVGQVTITAGINVAAAIYLIGAAGRIFGFAADAKVPVFGTVTSWSFQVFVSLVLLVPQLLVNLSGIRLVSRLNDLSVWWHIAGVLLIVFALALFGRHHNPPSFLLSQAGAASPWELSSAKLADGTTAPALVVGDRAVASPLFRLVPALRELYHASPFPLVFVLALLQAQWTYTGYDASAHVAEETRLARKNVAWGVFLSVAVSAVVGWLMLLALTWSIPDGNVAAVANDPYPVLSIVSSNLPAALANAIALMIGGAMWLCGASSLTSMARMWYAFARDGGMPFSELLAHVDTRTSVPVPALLVTSALSVAICLYAAAYSVVTSISTIALYVAYGIPILLAWRARRRGAFPAEPGSWSLGRASGAVNAVALLWTAFICVVFSLPPNELVLWTMLGLTAALAIAWTTVARRRFRGPAAALSIPKG